MTNEKTTETLRASSCEALVEVVAKTIYEHSSCAPHEFEQSFGFPMRAWRIVGVLWDTDADKQLCEHERDDYRRQARAVINLLRESGLLAAVEGLYGC